MSQYSAPIAVKLPLLRVAHPSGEQCEAEVQKLRNNLTAPALGRNVLDSQDSLGRDISTKGVPAKTATRENNPLLFNFDHYSANDKELTPRSNWQKKVYHLDALLDQEREKCKHLETTSRDKITELEKLTTMLQS